MVHKHLGINFLKETVMNTKLSKLSELANILSVKSEVRANILALFSRFGMGHLLCRMSLEKPQGVSAVQLLLSLCLFRAGGESIYSIYKKGFRELLDTGKNCYDDTNVHGLAQAALRHGGAVSDHPAEGAYGRDRLAQMLHNR